MTTISLNLFFSHVVIKMDMSTSQRILGYMAVKHVASYRELKDQLHESSKNISGTTFYLCKIRRLKRLPFSTKDGKIMYEPKTPMKAVWEYCYEHDLVPATTLTFLKEVAKRGAVSTVELYDRGLDITDVRFFIDAFTKQWRFLKIRQVGAFNVFYRDEATLEKYMSDNIERIHALQSKELKRREKEGNVFEDVVEKFYQSKGFETRRNVWMTTPGSERIEIDIIAEKKFFSFPNDRSIIICVECKSWRNGEHMYSLTEFLHHYCKLNEILPSAIFHIWSYSYSRYFFTPSFCRHFPNVSLYYSKHIREAFKSVREVVIS